MYCPECHLKLSYADAPTVESCTLCGHPLQIAARDVLEHGKFDFSGEIRPTQIQLAEDIEDILDHPRGVGLLDGGTGIGKSFAYLIPLLLSIDPKTLKPAHGRAVISTAKKTLQDQLANKDLPFLINKIFGGSVPPSAIFTLYKGKSNYACWRLLDAVPPAEKDSYRQFIQRARTNQCPADIADWSGQVPHWWGNVAIEHCVLGAECPDARYCKPHPATTPLVVTNHHLTAIDAKLGAGMLLGDYQLVIFDEAHQAPDAYRSAMAHQITRKGVQRIRAIFGKSTPLRNAVNASLVTNDEVISSDLQELATKFDRIHRELREHARPNNSIDPRHVAEGLDELRHHAGTIQSKLARVLVRAETARQEAKDLGESTFGDDMELGEILAAISAGRRVNGQLNGISILAEEAAALKDMASPNYVTTCDTDKIEIKPIETGELFKETMPAPHKIFLSATLAMGTNFTHARRNFGLERDPNTHTLERVYKSPFDLSLNQVLLYVPQHVPVPAHAGMRDKRQEWVDAITCEIQQIVTATHGHAFVLCSARTDMNDFLDTIPHHFWEANNLHPVVQDRDATATLAEYLNTPRSVLFGLKSFWEGVDIAGDKLRAVIIPKLPFPFFRDPLINAMEERIKARGGNPFRDVQIPLMTFDMQQGTGRLIRTTKDRGIVAILDPRVWTGKSGDKHAPIMAKIQGNNPLYRDKRQGYGKTLLDALGFLSPTSDLRVVRAMAKKYFGSKS
jgi:ATP-dependent DNA helicase DinG